MRFYTARLSAWFVTICLCASDLEAQPPQLSRQQRNLLQALIAAVDASTSAASDEHAWLTHVLRASDGSHYVAVAVTPATEALPDGPVVVYVRLSTAAAPGVRATAERSLVREWLRGARTDPRLLPRSGVAIGEMPAMGAGTIGARGPGSVGSADLQAINLQRERARQKRDEGERRRRAELEGAAAAPSDRLPFEDFEVSAAAQFADGTRSIQRALAAGPGSYHLFVAWADASQPVPKARLHVARRALQLAPAAPEFGLSSIIIADRIAVRDAPYSSIDQRGHPYAIGVTDITPSRDTVFSPPERLSLAFQIVNPSARNNGKPDVVVTPRLVRLDSGKDEVVASLSPLTYNDANLPADFDVRVGHPLIAAMAVPLATVGRGHYRLVITAEDRVAAAVSTTGTEFTIVGTPASLLAEAPALFSRFDPNNVLLSRHLPAVLEQLIPQNPSPALAASIQSARTGRFADLLIGEAVPPAEQGVRAALNGLALLSLGDLGAGALFERARDLAAAAGPTDFLLGAARALQNRDRDAIDAWRRAREAGTAASLVDPLIAGAYLRQRDFERAADAIAAREAAPDDAFAVKTFAATRIAVGRWPEAITALDARVARHSDDLEARWLLVRALYAAFVNGDRAHRQRLIAEALRYVEAKGAHAALAAEWLRVVTAS